MNTEARRHSLNIVVNGQAVEAPPGSLRSVLETLGFDLRHAAVAVNETIVPRYDLDGYAPADGDRVEVVAPMEGG